MKFRWPLMPAPGTYELRLGFSDLTAGQDVLRPVPLQSLRVTESTNPHAAVPQDAVANFSAQIALLGATANGVGASTRTAHDHREAGENDRVQLDWLAQQQMASRTRSSCILSTVAIA